MKPCLALLLSLAPLLALSCSKQEATGEIKYTGPDGQQVRNLSAVEDGTVKYEMASKNAIPPEAKSLHDKGRAAGSAGDHDTALKFFAQAAALAPNWPYPPYDIAFTHLLRKDYTNALAYYRKTDALAPEGFFTCKTALWALDREADGRLHPGTYLAYLSLEWAPESDRPALIGKILERSPAFAPIWKKKSSLAKTPEERLEHLEKGLSLEPDPETFGILSLNRAATLHELNRTAEAKEILQALQAPTNSASTRALARDVAKTIR